MKKKFYSNLKFLLRYIDYLTKNPESAVIKI